MRFFLLVSGSVRPSRQIAQTSMPSRRVDGMAAVQGGGVRAYGTGRPPCGPQPGRRWRERQTGRSPSAELQKVGRCRALQGTRDTEGQFPDERPIGRTLTPFGRRLVCHAPPRTQEGHPPRHPSKHKRFAVRSRSCVSQTSNGRRAAKVSPTRRDLQHAFALPCSIGVRLLALAAFTTGFIRQLEMGPRAICSVCAFAAATRGANHARAGLTYNGYGRGIARSGRAPPERWLLLQ